jgi:hypothetical protein
MANDPTRQVQDAFHPGGHPNKTPVNELNPIFGRPADPVITQDSIEQASVVQSEKHPRETVQSPLLNEAVMARAEESGSGTDRTQTNASFWTQTKGQGLTSDTSSMLTGAEYRHGSGAGSSKITPVVPVDLPTQEEAERIKATAAAEWEQRRAESSASVA